MKKIMPEVAPRSNVDALKWFVVIAMFAAGFWANYQYAQVEWALRLAGWIVLVCLMLVVAVQTRLGKKTWGFAKEARSELRKVFWPTRQETIQTTTMVVVMVIVASLLLWGVDSILLWLVTLLTGRG